MTSHRRGDPAAGGLHALLGWLVVVLVLHLAVVLALQASLRASGAAADRPRPDLMVVGQLELEEPAPVGPAGAAALPSPGTPPGGAETLVWVPVPPPQPPLKPEPVPQPPLTVPAVPSPPAQPAEPEPEEARPVTGVAALEEPPAVEAAAPAPVTLPIPPDPALAQAAGPIGPVAAVTPAEAAPAFEWPPSTRLSYRLTGQYRGDIEGQAHVEWLREGDRYAVQLDIRVGLSMAPLMSRRMSSEGALTQRGLAPERYSERTRVGLRDPRESSVRMGPAFVHMADGSAVPAPVGVQDTASQFIQLAYRFSTEAGLLETGRTVTLPLALPRRLDTWVYDVIGPEVLDTPFGPIETVHLKPRPVPRPGDCLLYTSPSPRD